jgi:hypothetical protein
MKYKFKKRLICEFATYMYKRKRKAIILKATDISTVQMLKHCWNEESQNINYCLTAVVNNTRPKGTAK